MTVLPRSRQTPAFLPDDTTDIKGISVYGDCMLNVDVRVNGRRHLVRNTNRASWLGPVRAIRRLRRVRKSFVRKPSHVRFERARVTLEGLINGSRIQPGRADRRFLWPEILIETFRRIVLHEAELLRRSLVDEYPRTLSILENSLREGALRTVPSLTNAADADELCVFALRNFFPYQAGSEFFVQTRELLGTWCVKPVDPFRTGPHRLLLAPRWFHALLAGLPTARDWYDTSDVGSFRVSDAVSCSDEELDTLIALWDDDLFSVLNDPVNALEAARNV